MPHYSLVRLNPGWEAILRPFRLHEPTHTVAPMHLRLTDQLVHARRVAKVAARVPVDPLENRLDPDQLAQVLAPLFSGDGLAPAPVHHDRWHGCDLQQLDGLLDVVFLVNWTVEVGSVFAKGNRLALTQ